MAKVFRIHPGIGFARVGPSLDGYFLAGKTAEASPIDIDAAGNEVAFRGYKDGASIMRRQGAQFHIFEYDQDAASGVLTLVREVTNADASIEWSVSLTAAKAAGKQMTAVIGPDGERMIVPANAERNEPPAGFGRADLSASVNLLVTGTNAGPALGAEPKGRIVGNDLFIGEARTDADGRLVVLAGRGHAASWETPPKAMDDYLNNPTWYDDIADGSVDAVITVPGEGPVQAVGAWVFTTPPDFAPDVYPVTSLFDIAEQAIGVPLPANITYPQDIAPILRRASNIYFVNTKSGWSSFHKNFNSLQNLGSAAATAQANRKAMRNLLLLAVSQMTDYALTERQLQILDAWVNGTFQEQVDATRPALDAPVALDRGSLEHCVGGGFFPGIEAGATLRQPTIYSELGRLTRGNFTDYNGAVYQIEPGIISARMACPWQADFVECYDAWWPAQRPDIVGRSTAGAPGLRWARGTIVGSEDTPQSHQNMVDHFAQLGVVQKSGNDFIEVGRDVALGV
jgi:hypothetical protein